MGSLLVQTILKSLKADHAAVPAILEESSSVWECLPVSTCSSEWSLNDPSRTFASADHTFIARTAGGRLDGENESEPFVQTKFHPSCHPLVCTGTDTASQHQNKTTTISWAVQTHPDRSFF